jgi:photosystem II stability/assembly factor-like uncharacterized protein
VRTTNGGKTWQTAKVPGADSLDFRDVEAFDARVAFLLSIGAGPYSRIYKTIDGGASWTQQYIAQDPRTFLDEFAFWDSMNGIAVGDAIDKHLFILRTSDGGQHWERIPPSAIPEALPGEGAFAASGSGITVQGRRNVWIGSGVHTARVYRSMNAGNTWSVAATPILHDTESSGVFSVAFFDASKGIVVGGDYQKEGEIRKNAALTNDGGLSWKLVGKNPPTGFRSAVLYVTKDLLITVGPSGSDLSKDGGRSWKQIDVVGYHAVSRARMGSAIWAVGERGRISRFRDYLDW